MFVALSTTYNDVNKCCEHLFITTYDTFKTRQ